MPRIEGTEGSRRGAVDRAFHAKSLLAVDQATVTFRTIFPKGSRSGLPSPAHSYRAITVFRTPPIMPAPTIVPTCAHRGQICRSASEQHDLLRPITTARTPARARIRGRRGEAGGGCHASRKLVG